MDKTAENAIKKIDRDLAELQCRKWNAIFPLPSWIRCNGNVYKTVSMKAWHDDKGAYISVRDSTGKQVVLPLSSCTPVSAEFIDACYDHPTEADLLIENKRQVTEGAPFLAGKRARAEAKCQEVTPEERKKLGDRDVSQAPVHTTDRELLIDILKAQARILGMQPMIADAMQKVAEAVEMLAEVVTEEKESQKGGDKS
jgi:hypothetical protein